jgi:hypothetical protein
MRLIILWDMRLVRLLAIGLDLSVSARLRGAASEKTRITRHRPGFAIRAVQDFGLPQLLRVMSSNSTVSGYELICTGRIRPDHYN